MAPKTFFLVRLAVLRAPAKQCIRNNFRIVQFISFQSKRKLKRTNECMKLNHISSSSSRIYRRTTHTNTHTQTHFTVHLQHINIKAKIIRKKIKLIDDVRAERIGQLNVIWFDMQNQNRMRKCRQAKRHVREMKARQWRKGYRRNNIIWLYTS